MALLPEGFKDLVSQLLGISTFKPPDNFGVVQLQDDAVHQAREAMGGSLEVIPQVRLRWYPPDIERAQRAATNGDMTLVGQLNESMKLDGVFRGLIDARTAVVHFPKRMRGSQEVVDVLQSKVASDRSVYDEMIPATEAKLVMADGDVCGVGIGEMVPVRGRNYPVLVRRFPQNLWYLWSRDQWYYRSIVGLLPITPGMPDASGNSWVLHMPGGRLAPWNSGLWNACGRAYINKTQSIFGRQQYEAKHAHPIRVAFAALGAAEEERKGMLAGLIRFALNAAAVVGPGWDVKLVESNGQGIKVYADSIEFNNAEMATAICGSPVMLKGTVGFSSIDPFKVVAGNLMRSTASAWDHTVNTQILPPFVGLHWGTDALRNAVTIETDVDEPKDRSAEVAVLNGLGPAIKALVEAAVSAQIAAGVARPIAIDVVELFTRFGIPTVPSNVPLDQMVPPPAGKALGGGDAAPASAPKTETAAIVVEGELLSARELGEEREEAAE